MNRHSLPRRLVLAAALLVPFALGCSSDPEPSGHEGEDHGEHGAALAAPTDLVATLANGGVHLTWRDNSTGEAEFMVLRKDAASEWASVGTTEPDATSFHDGTVVSGTTYTFMVHGMNETGASAPSNEVVVEVP